MAYHLEIELTGQEGSEAHLFGTPIMFSEIFGGQSQFYPGSTIQVEESLLMVTQVLSGREQEVDVDYGWYLPHKYLGTYQLIYPLTATENETEGGEGYLVNEFQKIRRYSTYTIVAHDSVPIGTLDTIEIDNCNFQLRPVITNVVSALIDDLLPKNNTGIFKGKTSIRKVSLRDTAFNPKIIGVGLYYKPAVQGIRLFYDVAVINTISVDIQPMPNTECTIIATGCDAEFTAFYDTLSHDNIQNRYVLTADACNTSLGEIPTPRTFTCSDGQSRTYYFCGGQT